MLLFVNALILPQNGAILAMANPLAGADKQVAAWFHVHLTQTFVTVLRALSEPGSGTWIGIVLFFLVIFFLWKRSWPAIVTLIVAVPGGMLMNELLKILVHRPRPYLEGPFVDWSGYSFASGHTIAATLLYGQLAHRAGNESAALACADQFHGDSDRVAGRVQSHCLGRALSDGRACRDRFRYSLVGILSSRG